jgi:hypothetical protein
VSEELVVVKNQFGQLQPATAADVETVSAWKVGQAKRIESVNMSPRVLSYHQRYWGGLIQLALEYWQPEADLISAAERKTMAAVTKWYGAQGLDPGPLDAVFREYAAAVTDRRRGNIDLPPRSRVSLHIWIKDEIGHFDLIETPAGLRKEYRSTNFASMGQEGFEEFYGKAFHVCWVSILSAVFDNEAESHDAVQQLLSLA